MNRPLVSICCQTYNHKKYIVQAIESFIVQKTNFYFELLLRDDASTDGTQEIVKAYSEKYPDIINPLVYSENQYQKGVSPFIDNLKRAKGKYIAICEGDDYWTDPYKLQKQVDFLEANPDYGLVSSDKVLINANGYIVPDTEFINKQRKYMSSGDVFWSLLVNVNFISTLTVCVRAKPIKKLSKIIIEQNLWYVYDLWFWLNIAMDYKIKVMMDKMAAYRIHELGISKSTGFFLKRSPLVRQYIISKLLKEKKNSSFNVEHKKIIVTILISTILNRNLTIKEKGMTIISIINNPFLWSYIFMTFVKATKKKIKHLYHKMV